jgi:hypothetical protein
MLIQRVLAAAASTAAATALLTGLLAPSASAQTGIHPRYDFFNLSSGLTPVNQFYGSSPTPLVGGMDVFPDGRVVIAEWGVPASVYILSGIKEGNTNIQVKRFAKGLDNVMGLKIVNGVIYVLEREGLTQLIDSDNNGEADQYNCINQSFPSNTSMLNLAYDLGWRDGAFWAALSADVAQGGYSWGSSQKPSPTALPGRATAYKLNLDGTSEAWATGFRNANGMEINGQDLFVTDNEGSWTPTAKLIHIKQGKFYGHRSNPVNPIQTAANNVETRPVLWSNWEPTSGGTAAHSFGRSFGNPLMMRKGPYAGQFLIPDFPPDFAQNRVIRVFVESINGELQGVAFPFIKGGTTTGPHRLKELEDGSIVVGIVGSNCCWGARSGMGKGLNVLRPNAATAPFEVVAIRSKGVGIFEVEFNRAPVDANLTSKYTVRTWRNVPVETYGGGRNTGITTASVASATPSVDGKKVTLAVTGLPDAAGLASESGGRVVKFVFNDLTSGATADDALYTPFAVYTLNQYGPGADYHAVSIAPQAPGRTEAAGWRLSQGPGHHVIRFLVDDGVTKSVSVYDMKGARRLELRGVQGATARLETSGLGKGLYLVRVSGARGAATSQPMMIH